MYMIKLNKMDEFERNMDLMGYRYKIVRFEYIDGIIDKTISRKDLNKYPKKNIYVIYRLLEQA